MTNRYHQKDRQDHRNFSKDVENLSGCAHAADPWSLTINLAQNRGGGRQGGCAPPHPPAFRGAPPPGPLKKALHALGCSGCSLSRDRATCPGQLRCPEQNFFSNSDSFLNEPLVPGSFSAWGRTFPQRVICLRTSHLPRATSLPGAELFPEIDVF